MYSLKSFDFGPWHSLIWEFTDAMLIKCQPYPYYFYVKAFLPCLVLSVILDTYHCLRNLCINILHDSNISIAWCILYSLFKKTRKKCSFIGLIVIAFCEAAGCQQGSYIINKTKIKYIMEALQVSGVSKKEKHIQKPKLGIFTLFMASFVISYVCLYCTIITLLEVVIYKCAFGSVDSAVALFTIKLCKKVNSCGVSAI